MFLTVCGPGTFLNGIDICEDCEIGYWNMDYNQTECQRCTGGRTTEGQGKTSDQDCGKQMLNT